MVHLTLSEKALAFAKQAHTGQVRKYTNEPYINHCIAVSELVRAVPGATDVMVAAALLHDTIEDTKVTITDLETTFGPDVARLVWYLTEQTPLSAGNRAYRKQAECDRLASTPAAAQTIKLADLIDNSRTIVRYDPDFARVYLREKYALALALARGDPVLRARAITIAAIGLTELYGAAKARQIIAKLEG